VKNSTAFSMVKNFTRNCRRKTTEASLFGGGGVGNVREPGNGL
jgi:hypothetical protein